MIFALVARKASPQVIQLQAGASTLFGAQGGSIEARGPTFTIGLGAGLLSNKFVFGLLLRKVHRRRTFTIGDDAIEFDLPTDIFGGAHYVPIRGIGVESRGPTSHLKAFLGTTSVTSGAPFFRGAQWGRPVGMLFGEWSVAPHWRAYSRNALSTQQTSIQGVEWRPDASLKVAGSAGIGTDKPYFSSSTSVDRGWFSANAAYVGGDSGFRRIALDSPMAAEAERENLSFTLRPSPSWSFSGTRQNLLQTAEQPSNPVRVTVNQIATTLNVAGFRLGGGAFDSHGRRLDNLGISWSVGRSVSESLDVVVDYFRSAPSDGPASTSAIATVKERVSPRVDLLQTVTHAGNQTTMGFGGQFLSNPFTVGVSHQIVYAPFRNGNPFVQALGVDLRLRLPGGFQLQGATYTTLDGRLRYTLSGSHVLYRSGNADNERSGPVRFAKYLVCGRVLDGDSQPVSGAVIRIDREVLITDEDGRFFLRVRTTNRIALTVLPDEFTSPGHFDLVSAPASVQPVAEAEASEILIVVRRRE